MKKLFGTFSGTTKFQSNDQLMRAPHYPYVILFSQIPRASNVLNCRHLIKKLCGTFRGSCVEKQHQSHTIPKKASRKPKQTFFCTKFQDNDYVTKHDTFLLPPPTRKSLRQRPQSYLLFKTLQCPT